MAMLVTASFFCNRGMQTNLKRNFKLTKQNDVSNLTFSGIWNLCVYGSMQSPTMLSSQCSIEYSHKCWVWMICNTHEESVKTSTEAGNMLESHVASEFI